jgi:hypothetical protein
MKIDSAELEKLIRAGRFSEVEKALKSVSPKKVARKDAFTVANAARRVNQYSLALKILNPIVRAEKHSPVEPATEAERIEYCESLRKLGAVEEARQILTAIDGRRFPQTLLIQSFCCFSQWRYDLALPLLFAYEESEGLTDYQRQVGGINLAAALVHQNRLDEAAGRLEDLRARTEAAGNGLLHGNSLELSAQLCLRRRDFKKVHGHLDRAERALKEATNLELLWTKKWRAIAASLEGGKVGGDLLAIREAAKHAGHWETFRDCSFHIGAIGRDRGLLARVYCGTPFASYRENMMREIGDWFTPPQHYTEGSGKILLDAESGRFEDGREALPAGQAHHRLLILAASDLFRPLPLVAAFAQLFPDEYFNALSSPGRVHQTVKRLRRALDAQASGISVLEKNGAYSLALEGDTALKLRAAPPPADARAVHLNLVLREVGSAEFSISQASRILGASTSTSQRLLRWAVEASKLRVEGHGPRTRYRAA